MTAASSLVPGDDLDRRARAEALDGTRSLLLQAPAGSGKTTVLTARFLTLLTLVDHPEEILALTFTRKATAEMRQRVLVALQSGAGIPGPPGIDAQLLEAVQRRDQQLGWNLRDNPARLRIETIDALNSRLARTLPVAARSAPTLTIAAAPAVLYARAARNTLECAWLEPETRPAVRLLFERLDNSWVRLQGLLADMLEHRSHWLPRVLEATDIGLTRRVQESLQSLIGAQLARIHSHLPPHLLREAEELLDHSQQLLPGIPPGPLSAAAGSLARWQALSQLALSQKGWRRRFTVQDGFQRSDRQMKERVAAWIEQLDRLASAQQLLREVRYLPDARLSAEDQAALEALTLLLVRAAAQLHVVFAETGKVDYAYVAGAARASLSEQGEPSELALRTGYALRHILVDEFQDTSYEQVNLLRALTVGWEPGDGRTLFLVGDPMQSIYQFREAEVGLFLRARDVGIGSLRVHCLQLRRNFRTRAPLVEWINRQFAQLFPAEDDARLAAIRFLPSVPVHGNEGADGAAVAVGLHCFESEQRAAEARRVLQIVQQARAAEPASSIAVLVASREHATTLTAVLREAGMPLRGVNLEPLAQRAAVRDLTALTRVLLHGADRTAWLALLRAPWGGLRLAELAALCEQDEGDFFATLQRCGEQLGYDGDAVLAATLSRLCSSLAPALLGAERDQPLWQRVEHCWLRLAGPAIYPGESDRLVSRRFLDALALHDDPEGLVGEALGEFCQQLFSVEPPQPGAVEIMTMHAAKGLEWDVVILPGLGRRTASDSDPLLHWLELPRPGEGRESDLLLCPIRASDLSDRAPARTLSTYIKRMRRARARIERVRLLYVATTRAKRALHLLGALKAPPSPLQPAAPPGDSLLEILWPAIGQQFSSTLVGAASSQAAVAGAAASSGVIWRLPGDWTVPPPPPEPQPRCLQLARAAAAQAPEYSWVGVAARAVGTIVHAELHRLALQSHLPEAAALGYRRDSYDTWLAELGVSDAEYAAANERISEALRRTLADPRGRWLLSGHHREARSEWRLSGLHAGQLVNVVFDRMLVDEQGHRWIIDFKTGTHEGGAAGEFVDSELERYRAQLQRYGALARQLGREPVRLALYFPLLGVFRELSRS